VTRLLKAGAAVVDRLVPRADADASCGYVYVVCWCSKNHQWIKQCAYCSDGSYSCSGCYKTEVWCQ
jgi:hypothetical protein